MIFLKFYFIYFIYEHVIFTLEKRGESFIWHRGEGLESRHIAFHVAVLISVSVVSGKPGLYPTTRFANPCCRESVTPFLLYFSF